MGLSSSRRSPDLGDPGPAHTDGPDRYDSKLDDDPQHRSPECRPGGDLSGDADRTPGPEPGT